MSTNIIRKPIYTEKEALKLFTSLDEMGFKWRSGNYLMPAIGPTEIFLEYLPCDLYINTECKIIHYDSCCINGKEKYTRW